jgi:hypothetical protein
MPAPQLTWIRYKDSSAFGGSCETARHTTRRRGSQMAGSFSLGRCIGAASCNPTDGSRDWRNGVRSALLCDSSRLSGGSYGTQISRTVFRDIRGGSPCCSVPASQDGSARGGLGDSLQVLQSSSYITMSFSFDSPCGLMAVGARPSRLASVPEPSRRQHTVG